MHNMHVAFEQFWLHAAGHLLTVCRGYENSLWLERLILTGFIVTYAQL